jgi:lipid A 4'-phosphatase
MGIMTAAEPQTEIEAQEETSNVSLLLLGAAVVGTVAVIVFLLFPEIDLKTSTFFYTGNGVFSGKAGGIFYGRSLTTPSDVIRMVLYVSFAALCLLNAFGLAASIIRKRAVFGLKSGRWLFLGACLVIGPGIVGNVILKDHWGRARPVQIVEFGGSKTYSPPLVMSDQCDRNCSFVAGESSMMYATFFAAAFLFPAMGTRLIIAGIFFGLLSGIVRISQGAHFLSDVIFAGVAMALTVAGIYLLFRAISRTAGNTLPQWCSW